MKPLIIATLLAVLGFGSSCMQISPTRSNKPDVVVSIPPYVFLVKEIAGNTLNVKSAVKPNFDPHTTEITPKEMATIQTADLFIAIGESHEKDLLKTLQEQSKGVSLLEMDKQIPLLNYPKNTHCGHTCKIADSKDLHFWLGPKHLVLQVNILIQSLSKLNPKNSALYSSNGQALIKKIKRLDRQLEEKLRPFEKKTILVSHPSLGYFCQNYHLIQMAVESEGKNPNPQHIAKVYNQAKQADVICVFTTPQFNNKGAERIADQLDLRIESFDPLGENPLETIEKIGNDITR